MICLLLITIIACKKKTTTTTAKVNNTVSTAYVSPLTGTWVNSTDITDYFSIKDTIFPNCSTCYHELIMIGAQYLDGKHTDNGHITEATLMNPPGQQGYYTGGTITQPMYYPTHIIYTGGIIKIQIDGYPTAGVTTTRIFNKQ